MSGNNMLAYSNGKSAGRREANEEVDTEESRSIAIVISTSSAFRKGVADAQDYLAQTYSDLKKYTDEDKVSPDFRGGFLWLSKREASSVDEKTIETDAKSMLVRHFLQAAKGFSDEQYKEAAQYCMDNLREEFHLEFERGQSALLAVSLKEEDMYRMGVTARLHILAGNVRECDTEALVENDPQARNARIEHYADFLAKSIGQFGEQLATHLEANVGHAAQAICKPKMEP